MSMWDNLNQARQKVMGSARGQGWLRGAQKTFSGGYGSDLKNAALVSSPLGIAGLLGRLYYERSKYNKAKAAYDAGTTYPDEKGYVTPEVFQKAGEETTATTPDKKPADDLNSQYTSYWESMKSQFDPLYQKYLSDLESSYNENKTSYERDYNDAVKKLSDDYWMAAEDNERNFGMGAQKTQNAYSGMGVGDSSYRNNALGEVYKNFDQSYANLGKQRQAGENDLNYQKEQYFNSLNKNYNDQLDYAKTAYNNFYNPNSPQFNSLDDLTSAKGTLDSSLQSLGQGAKTIAGKVNPYNLGYKPTNLSQAPGTVAPQAQTAGYMPNKSAYGYLKDWLYGVM